MKLAGIVQDSVTDGPGLRFVVFTQGCNHHCEGCHNPNTWDIDKGKTWTTQSLLTELDSNPLTKGVTISGGEPFLQAKALVEFAKAVKERKLELAIYSGYLFEEIIKDMEKVELLEQCDILIDGPFIKAQRSLDLMFKGSKNQRIVDVKKSLESNKIVSVKNNRWTN